MVCSDNHDQIGNRADGRAAVQRCSTSDQLAIAALVTLLSPFTPMIFMGEEWGASTPWQFFTSHPEPELAELIRGGPARGVRPDGAGTPATYPTRRTRRPSTASKLDWSELEQPRHAELLAFTTRLMEIRRTYPDFTDPRFDQGRSISDDEAGWLLIQRGEIVMVINFSDQPTEVGLDSPLESVITVGKTELSAEVGPAGSAQRSGGSGGLGPAPRRRT